MRNCLIFAVSALTFVPAAQAQTSPSDPALAPAPTPAPACTSPDHRAFDFWVGKWDVRQFSGGPVVAHSLIEKLYDGCTIRENWMPLKGSPGGSLSAYDKRSGKWRQIWTDSGGSWAEFEGGAGASSMVLTGFWRGSGPKGEDGLTRMTYTREAEGTVRQQGDFSADEGKTWVASFDFLYMPAREG